MRSWSLALFSNTTITCLDNNKAAVLKAGLGELGLSQSECASNTPLRHLHIVVRLPPHPNL